VASSKNATEKRPLEAVPAGTGAGAEFQWYPPSRVRKTRDMRAPPVTNHARLPPGTVVRQVPLAAKMPSPLNALAIVPGGIAFQVAPPSDVRSTRNAPSASFTGSPTRIPLFSSQNAIAS
jgi:hypothetical protein